MTTQVINNAGVTTTVAQSGGRVTITIVANNATPTPAPSFSVSPSVSGTPIVGQLLSSLTFNDGTVLNGTITTRTILLAGVAKLSSYVLLTGDIGSLITYKVDATGTSGSVSATSAGVAVIASGSYFVTTPVITSITPDVTYPPEIDAALSEDTLVGDTARLQYSHDATFSTGITTVDRVLANTSTQSFNLTSITTGTYRFRASIVRGGVQVSDWSATVTHGPDDLAPSISSATASSTGTTTGTVGVTTDTGEGTIYFVLVLTNSQPSAAQIKAGQNSAGAPAAKTATISPTSIGAKTVGVTGLSQSTAYYTFVMHEDATGNKSNVVGASAITTDTAPAFSATETAAPASVVSPPAGDYTFSGISIGAADSTRDVYVAVEYDNGGGAISHFQCNGVDMTKLVDAFSGGTEGFVYRLNVPTGTTANFKAQGGNFSHINIKVWRVVGGGTPTVVTNGGTYDASPFAQTGTVPVGGCGLVFAAQGTETGTPTWTNATGSSTTKGGGWTHMSAVQVTAGPQTVSYTGFANYAPSYFHLLLIPPA